jgi:serine protease AprX
MRVNHAPARRTGRRSFGTALVALVAAASLSTAGSAGWAATHSTPSPRAVVPAHVIVLADHGAVARVEARTRLLGGTIERELPLIDGFSAKLPLVAVTELRLVPGVVSVTPDGRAKADGAGYDPGADANSMDATTRSLGIQGWWKGGYTGAGVDVALIDSGVAPVQGLSAPGKVVYGPDLSLESQAPNLTNLDTYGHGTFMAGLIAGRDDAAAQPYDADPASAYRGVAPDARIVSVKVATADGGTDVSQVIAGIDWVVQHAHDPGLNIRVLNLSYGTNSTQSYQVDPLAYAVEQAWQHGLVVVASAGNSGYQRGNGAPGLADPAYDPEVIGVGAADSEGKPGTRDDRVASFSASSGCGGCRMPDLVAPGTHLQGLRVVNSWLDANHPEGRLDDRYFRGSGTSESAAVTSGVAALVLQRYPTLTPDGVKRFLVENARKLSGSGKNAQGGGELDLSDTRPPTQDATQKLVPSTGTGSLELSRGQDHVTRDGVALTGEYDIFGMPVDTAALAAAEADGSSWSGGIWNGSSWSGSFWSGSSWSGSSWSGSSWSGSSWSGSSLSGSSWSGSSWSGSSWSDAHWG